MVRKLMESGADAFRINMSHGEHEQKAELVKAIRALEKELRRPTHDPVRPAGAKASRRQFQGRFGRAAKGDQVRARPRHRARQFQPGRASPPRIVRQRRRRRPAADRRRQGPAQGHRGRRATDRHRSAGRRARFQPQGRQRARRGRADPGADRKGPRRPRFRARAEGRLDRFVVRPAARGRRRGARADRRQGGADGEDRKARGDRPADRDHRACPTG